MATLNKITFQNGASGETPVNAKNLNNLQTNVETFGNNIVTETDAKITTLESGKVNQSFVDVIYTASTGILKYTRNDGKTLEIDLPLELIVESGKYDEANKQIALTLANGDTIAIPVSDLLDDFYTKEVIDNELEERDTKITNLETQVGDISSVLDEINGEVV